MAIDPELLPILTGSTLYRLEFGVNGWVPIRWQDQRVGDTVLTIEWNESVITELSVCEVLVAPSPGNPATYRESFNLGRHGVDADE